MTVPAHATAQLGALRRRGATTADPGRPVAATATATAARTATAGATPPPGPRPPGPAAGPPGPRPPPGPTVCGASSSVRSCAKPLGMISPLLIQTFTPMRPKVVRAS